MSRAACTGTGMECCAGRRAHPSLGYFAAGCVSVRSGRARGTGASSRAIKTRASLGMRHSAALVVFGRAQGDYPPLNKFRCRPQSPKVTQGDAFTLYCYSTLPRSTLASGRARTPWGTLSEGRERRACAPRPLALLEVGAPGESCGHLPNTPLGPQASLGGSNARSQHGRGARPPVGSSHLAVVLRSTSPRTRRCAPVRAVFSGLEPKVEDAACGREVPADRMVDGNVLTERRRSRTYPAVGYTTSPVLKVCRDRCIWLLERPGGVAPVPPIALKCAEVSTSRVQSSGR